MVCPEHSRSFMRSLKIYQRDNQKSDVPANDPSGNLSGREQVPVNREKSAV
jgi:hypothetical protein